MIAKIKEIEFAKVDDLVIKLKENKDYVLIHSNDEYNIFRIHSKKAAMELGKGAQWCITMKDSYYFDSYYSNGNLFYFLIRKYRKNDALDKIGVVCNVDNSITYYSQNDEIIRKKYLRRVIRKDFKSLDLKSIINI
jgi:hypothetical protein